MRILSAILLVAAALPLSSTRASAQAVLLDEGSFVVSIAGRPVGMETFRIGRAGLADDAQVIAQGSLELEVEGGERIVESALATVGTRMSLDAYQAKVSGQGALQVFLQWRGDRLVAETTSAEAVEERIYRRALPGTPTVLLDHLLAHHYFFLTPHERAGDAPILVVRPRPGSQVRAVLRSEGVEALAIGDEELRARRLRLELGGAVHDIWLDARGRVLRVEIPGDEYVALRRDPPK